MQTESHQDFEQQYQYGATIRALSGDTAAQIRDWQLFRGSTPFGHFAPHLNLENLKEPWCIPRGVIDGIALRLRNSDTALHESLSPDGLIESLIFEVLEQIRVESICPEDLKGSRQNIQAQYIAWMQQFIASGGVEGSIGLLLISIFSTVWMKLNGQGVPQLMQDIVEATRAGLAEDMGPLLSQLKIQRYCQADYSQTSLQVVELVAHLIDQEYRNQSSIRTKRKNQSASLLKIQWVPPHTDKLLDGTISTQQSLYEKRGQLKQSLNNYHVFNKAFDIEVEAKKKIRPAQLAIYQEQLNEQITKQNIPWAKLTRLYQTIFSSDTPHQWQTTETEGLLDRRYLIRSATSPLQPALYKKASSILQAQAKITLLIDCSGSMKEQRVKIASCVDSLVRILEQAGIQSEVLGYSTSSWQGGRPFKEWRKSGQAPNPGRLNERAHWIFKDFHTSWRRARPGIAALLRPEIYAESIDGEALLWAAERLQKNTLKIPSANHLILFSDGCPMDRATIEANGEEFLKNHLLQVIAWFDQHPNIQLWGCGIGEELRRSFKNRLSWDVEPDNVASSLQNWAAEFKSSLAHNKK